MLRNLLAFAAVLADTLAKRLTRHTIVADSSSGYLPDTWVPEHIHVGGGVCQLTGCQLSGFHFHDRGGVYRTLAEHQAAQR